DAMRLRATPFSDEVHDFIERHDVIYVIEQNRDAQMRSILINELEIDPFKLVPILNFDGMPITAEAIVKQVIEMGVSPESAESVVSSMYDEIVKQAREELFTPDSLVPAILGGLAVAVVGGGIWAGVVVATNYEIGYLAWGLGLAAGWGVVKASGGKKGLIPQLIAVASGLGGILFGKYFIFYHFFKQALVKQLADQPGGAEAIKEFTLLSGQFIKVFFQNLSAMATGHDALWIILAVVTAWSMAKAVNLPTAVLHAPPRERF
ncbi:MAG TPA: hypothetical protein PKO06_21335, partial [Candidatus Ozemobacteraceae bacterium]|nr:hypothetical protein [Candidatus Ozemobacteraceae bacterium]